MVNSMRVLDFDRFHQHVLPQAHRNAEAASTIGANRSLALKLKDSDVSWTYHSDGTKLTFAPGFESAKLIIQLDQLAFEAYQSERFSLVGLFYTQQLELLKGNIGQLLAWEPALQALFFDRPIWSHDDIERVADFELERSFTMQEVEEQPQLVSEYLNTLGYLHIRNVFSTEEIEQFRSVVEQQKSAARVDDGLSWWARNVDGEEVCCRVTYMARRSELIAKHTSDERLLALAALAKDPLVPIGDRMDGVSVVIKNPNIVEGLSDLPWHRDCGQGGHHLICPSLNVGVQLDEASAENGQLKFLAGSANHANGPVNDSDPRLPIAAINAQAGDVTVHYAHVMHVAPPPLSESGNRRVLYCGYAKQELLDSIAEGKSYNDVLFDEGQGRIRSPQERSAKTGNKDYF